MNSINLAVEFYKTNKIEIFLLICSNLIVYIIQSLIIPELTGKLSSVINLNNKVEIQYILVLFVYIWLLLRLFQSLDIVITGYITPELKEFINNYLWKKILKKFENNYDNINVSKLILRLSSIPNNIRHIFNENIRNSIPFIGVLITIMLRFYLIDIKLAIIVLFFISLLLIILYLDSKKIIKLIKLQSQYEEILAFNFEDKINNLQNIYAFNQVDYEYKNIANKLYKFKNVNIILYKQISNTRQKFFVITLLFLMILVIVIFQLKFNSNKSIDNATFLSLVLTSLFISMNIQDFVAVLSDMIYDYGILLNNEVFFKYLEENNNISYNKNQIQIKSGKIVFKNIDFSYLGNKTLILDNFSLEIQDKEKVAILGKSGKGKSTIVKLIMCLYSTNKGNIYIDDLNINEYDPKSVRQYISYVSQNTILFSGSIYDNIRYGTNYSRQYILDFLDKNQLSYLFSNLENGIDTDVGLCGSKVSGGQRQIIYILRAILHNKPILILDEPSSSIDKNIKQQFIDLVKKFYQDKTMILITHDRDLLTLANRIIYL